MLTYAKPSEPHQFVVSDEDLFTEQGEFSHKRVLDVACYVCGDKPGQGMHAPPPPPPHTLMVAEVAKTLAGLINKSHDNLHREAARAAFTTLQQVRKMLGTLDADTYGEFALSNLDTVLDDVMTELRKVGWPR